MPSGFVKKVADQAGVSLASVEKYWSQAKEAAGKSYYEKDDKFWGTVTKIFKRKANKHLGLSLTETDLIMENFEKIKNIGNEKLEEGNIQVL